MLDKVIYTFFFEQWENTGGFGRRVWHIVTAMFLED
jgi:hypothetical protein